MDGEVNLHDQYLDTKEPRPLLQRLKKNTKSQKNSKNSKNKQKKELQQADAST